MKWQIRLVDEWKRALEWSSVRFNFVFWVFLLPAVVANWASIQDWLMKSFPGVPLAVWGMIGSISGLLLTNMFRLTKIERKPDAN